MSCRPRDQQPNTSSLLSPPLGEQALSSRHYGPPNPPAPAGSNSTGECHRRTSSDQSRSLQSSDVTFIDQNIKSYILLTILIFAAAQCAQEQKVSFLQILLSLHLIDYGMNCIVMFR